MLKNYFKTAFRGFRRNKSSFIINLAGLSIGLTCSFLIFLWVLDEMNVDQYHEDSDRIVQVMEFQHYSDEVSATLSTPGILARNLKLEFPEFEYAANYTWNSPRLFSKDNQNFYESGLDVENDFFNILSIDLIYGDQNQLLVEPNTAVISSEMAKKYFGERNPVGEGITYNNETELTITGVFREMPDNSTFQFDVLLNYEDWLIESEWATSWGNNGPRTIAKLTPGVSQEELNAKILDYIKGKDEDGDSNVDLFVYPFAKRYLYGQFENQVVVGGRIDYVRLFIIVAIFVLIIACINFMNLSTAKAVKRSKEVGIRKSIGASKTSLIGQFIGESMIISFSALFVSILFVELCLPLFNSITDKTISVDYSNPVLLSIYLGTVVVTGLLSGSYPAFYLSSIEAVKSLKGSLKSSMKEVIARKGLVVFQFSLSIILIISTLIIYRQIQYTQQKNLGYNKENLVFFTVEDEIQNNWDTFKEQLQTIPGVINVSRSSSTFLGRNSNTSGLEWQNKDPDSRILFENVTVDYGLIETMDFNLIEGRSFSPEFGIDSTTIIFNQAAIDVMGIENPIGEVITLWEEYEMEIIGVVEDFNFQSLRSEVEPLFFKYRPNQGWRGFVRIESNNIAETIAEIETMYKSFNSNYPFEYDFMDEQYAALYRSEMRIGELAKYFSFFAILISCLGLFGLSAFTAEQRSKEIGVRKVLGATVKSLVLLLSGDFTKLVLISIAISIPVSWLLMQQWMKDFAYSSGIEWWVFAIAGVSALIIAWLTVSWQSVKAALMDPVKSLKSE
ncbi:MAG: ABC transporter permease [Balneolaceae bacterium]